MLSMDDATLLRWRQAIDGRRSVRKFTGEALEPSVAGELEQLCRACAHLPGGGVRVVPVNGQDAGRRIFRWLPGGLATFIHRSSLAFAILSSGLPYDPEDAGFCGEQVVLDACSHGVGTCWVSGTFSRKAALSLAGAVAGERVVCVIAAGRPDSGAPVRHKHRKSFGQICDTPADALPEWIRDAIRCVQLAPSGTNRQPWWFEVRGRSTRTPEVVLWHKKPGMSYGGLDIGPRRIDHGIAMLHFSVGASSSGANGRWHLESDSGRGAVARFSQEG